jgi:hypothetical protein
METCIRHIMCASFFSTTFDLTLIYDYLATKAKACLQASSVRGRKESLNSQLLLETCVSCVRATSTGCRKCCIVQQFKIMASKRRAGMLFLLENCALKYDLCGNSRQTISIRF